MSIRTAKIILIIFYILRLIVNFFEALLEEDRAKRAGGMLGWLVGGSFKAYLFYLVGIFNL